jgi:CarboxypepD_reg-like domain
MFKKIYLASFLLVLISSLSIAQQAVKWQDSKAKSNDLIQFSGVVLEGDSLRAVPYTSIIVKNTNRGTISDYYGYYSFVAKKNDTIEFSAIGFNAAQFIIPDTLSTVTYSLIQILHTDTVFLKSVEVYPWPSKEQFKSAFLNLNLADDNLARATKNLERAALKEQMVGMAVDASLNYKYSTQQNQSKLYYAGQYPSNNLLNPIAWAKFIKAWKSGAFKK